MVANEPQASCKVVVNSLMPTAGNHQSLKNAAEHSNMKSNPENTHSTNNNTSGGGAIHYAFPLLSHQSSIYTLTLDEFQHTLSEYGKDFGSMNMDEFLNSIWMAEENQNQTHNQNKNQATNPTVAMSAQNGVGGEPAQVRNGSNDQIQISSASPSTSKGIMKQPSLPRQGSLTLPAPLCCKTVDEVWSEIQRTQQHNQLQSNQAKSSGSGGGDGCSNSASAQRQQTFGEMTLEDFLIKAGVVREQCPSTSMVPPPLPDQHHQHQQPTQQQQQPPTSAQYGFYQNGNNPQMGHTFRPGPMMGMPSGYPAMAQNGGVIGDPSGYVGGGASQKNNGYGPVGLLPPPAAVSYGGRVGNGAVGNGGSYGLRVGITSPMNLFGPDVMCGPGPVDGQRNQYGMGVGALRGRKRALDGPVEKVVERRQRRMIKNRESAARSRARKQAYTVELEAELNQLQEENAQLKQALAEIQQQRNEQYKEQQKTMPRTRAEKVQDKLRVMRRGRSCPP